MNESVAPESNRADMVIVLRSSRVWNTSGTLVSLVIVADLLFAFLGTVLVFISSHGVGVSIAGLLECVIHVMGTDSFTGREATAFNSRLLLTAPTPCLAARPDP